MGFITPSVPFAERRIIIMIDKIFFLAKRDLQVNRKRNKLTVISICISVFLICTVLVLSNSFYNQMLNEMKIADEEVLTVAFGNKENTLNYRYIYIYTDEDIELVKSADGVETATGIKGLNVDEMTYDDGKQIITSSIQGIDESYLENMNLRLAKGNMCQDDKEVIIGNSVYKATGLEVGEFIHVTMNGEAIDFVVAGIIEEQQEQAFSTLPTEINQLIALNNNSEFLVDSKYGFICALANDVTNLHNITNNIIEKLETDVKLMNALEGTGLSPIVATREDVKDMLARWFTYIDLFVGVIAVLIGVISAVNIVNIFAITIQERYRDIAVYKVVGASEKQVKNIFMLQSVILGLRGSLIGLILGMVISRGVIYILRWPATTECLSYLIALFVGILTSVCAGFVISGKTKNIEIEILMNE